MRRITAGPKEGGEGGEDVRMGLQGGSGVSG